MNANLWFLAIMSLLWMAYGIVHILHDQLIPGAIGLLMFAITLAWGLFRYFNKP